MATTALPAATRTVPGNYDRVFYSGISIALAATVFTGFASS